jgi:hypothetical protein
MWFVGRVASKVICVLATSACTFGSDAAPCDTCEPDAGAVPPSITCAPGPLADFYTRDVADLDTHEPGTALWCDTETTSRHAGYRGHRVAYVTTIAVSGGERTVVTTGQIWIPTTPTEAPRVVLANAHGATGLVARCAPSATFQLDTAMFSRIAPALPAPPVVVVPDYVGLGRDADLRAADANATIPDVLDLVPPVAQLAPTREISHPYLSLEGEGRAVVDLVRAAREIDGAAVAASPRWAVLGVSQGGHAALATGEVYTRGYGDDTTLLAVVAGAPGTALADGSDVEPVIENMLAPMVFAGLSLEHPELRVTDYLTDQVLGAFAITAGRECLTQAAIADWMVDYGRYLGPGSSIAKRPLDTEPLRSILLANSPGHAPTTPPIFVGQVEGDPFVRSVRTRRYVALVRSRAPVTYCEYAGDKLDRPWWERVNNHSAFSWMFGTAAGTCTDPSGAPTATTALELVVRALAP